MLLHMVFEYLSFFLSFLSSQGSGLDVPGPLEKDEDLDQARPIPGGAATFHVRPTTGGACLSEPHSEASQCRCLGDLSCTAASWAGRSPRDGPPGALAPGR